MGRDIVKVRRVGKTLVVTLTQDLLSEVELSEGDRVLLEASPPRRVIITKEVDRMPNTLRLELEMEVLAAKKSALEAQANFLATQHNLSMPVESGAEDETIVELTMSQLARDLTRVDVEISEKKLALFEAQGA